MVTVVGGGLPGHGRKSYGSGLWALDKAGVCG